MAPRPAEEAGNGLEPTVAAARRHIPPALVPRLITSPEQVDGLVVHRAKEGSWYAAHRVKVKLRDGREVRLFLKDFGTYRARKPDMEARRERELAVYRHLSEALRSAGVRVPRFYGAVWHPEERRWWLLLEDVQGDDLKHLEFVHWLGAASVLGRIHRTFEGAGKELAALRWPRTYDAAHFEEVGCRALESVRLMAPESVGGLEVAIDRTRSLLRELAAEPRTLVHGAYLPINVLVRRDGASPRFCPLDWELAGVGPGLYDLAFLADGFGGERLTELWRAYRGATGDRLPEEVEEVRPTLDALRVHKLLTMLVGAQERGLTEVDATGLARKAVQIASAIAVVSEGGGRPGRASP